MDKYKESSLLYDSVVGDSFAPMKDLVPQYFSQAGIVTDGFSQRMFTYKAIIWNESILMSTAVINTAV